MKPEDFDKILISVQVIFPLPGDVHDEKLVFRAEEVPVYETEKMYKSDRNDRIAKSKLMKPFKRYDTVLPEYEVYCLPGDEERAAELIRALVEPVVTLMLDRLQGIVTSAKSGTLVLDSKALHERVVERVDRNRHRITVIRASQGEPNEMPEP